MLAICRNIIPRWPQLARPGGSSWRGSTLAAGARWRSSVIPAAGADHAPYQLPPLPQKVSEYVQQVAQLCKPSSIQVCDGSADEHDRLIDLMTCQGIVKPLPKLHNCYLATTDPADVARVESKTFIVTPTRGETVPAGKPGVPNMLGNWMSPEEFKDVVAERFPSCMGGRVMYVIPFCMGPLGSSISKIGIECTDSPYVVASMRVMTRMGRDVLTQLGEDDFVRCLHSVGCPLPTTREIKNAWPCNPEKTVIAHVPENREILSFGSGYGGNSLLGKKCFALRIGSSIARTEGWLAEHMLILGITNPTGVKKYIAAAFPSACGKTNLAMMTPSIPGYKVECVGDDIAWMKFDEQGILRAINPENGFFGVAPGTSYKTNPNAMKTIESNTLFTNVAQTSDGGVFWEGMENEYDGKSEITSWTGIHPWSKSSGSPAAHPNSRFCTPAEQCPIIDSNWEDPEGVPISAILFGGRRPTGIPLVYEALSWQHGVMVGASMRSEATAAAEHKMKVLMHDPFAMRPFFGYNFGDYLRHWLDMSKNPKYQLPKIFHVNWFRKDAAGKFIWPGFGENIRVLDWIFQRLEGKDVAKETPIGLVPKEGSLDLSGLSDNLNIEELFSTPKDFWLDEMDEIEKFLSEQVGDDVPSEVLQEIGDLKGRLSK